jgi:hypothetical protein
MTIDYWKGDTTENCVFLRHLLAKLCG